MNKKVFAAFSVLLFISCLFFTACERPNTKYTLAGIDGHPDITVQSYEYCYIKLFDDGRYYYENKLKDSNIIRQSGNYSISEGVMTVSDTDNGNDYILHFGETIAFDSGQITITAEISAHTVTMIFEK